MSAWLYQILSWLYISTHTYQYTYIHTYIYLEVYIQETSVTITATYPRLPSIHLSIHRIVRYVASSILGPVMVVLTTSSRAIIISAPIRFCTSHWQYRREDRGKHMVRKLMLHLDSISWKLCSMLWVHYFILQINYGNLQWPGKVGTSHSFLFRQKEKCRSKELIILHWAYILLLWMPLCNYPAEHIYF